MKKDSEFITFFKSASINDKIEYFCTMSEETLNIWIYYLRLDIARKKNIKIKKEALLIATTVRYMLYYRHNVEIQDL